MKLISPSNIFNLKGLHNNYDDDKIKFKKDMD